MLIKKRSVILACIILTGCNGGVNLTMPGKPVVETTPITNPDGTPPPAPTSTPTPTPTPPTTGKNRIFVSYALIAMADSKSAQSVFNDVCRCEAKHAKIPGKFAALVATSDAPFANKYSVSGTIYQKVEGDEVPVANSYDDLISGKNFPITANAWQREVDNSYKNYAWTGQKDFHHPSQADYNCKDWSTSEGYGIVGQIGASGSDALSTHFQECEILAHVYCIEYQ